LASKSDVIQHDKVVICLIGASRRAAAGAAARQSALTLAVFNHRTTGMVWLGNLGLGKRGQGKRGASTDFIRPGRAAACAA
jgi:hypothetical protein